MKTLWFDRKFGGEIEIAAFGSILERLRGTAARIDEKLDFPREILRERYQGTWSIQENVGHLLDIEPLWQGRLDDFLKGREILRPADLTNQKTEDARHNESSATAIADAFRSARLAFVERLDSLDEADIRRVARHPRLGSTMRVIDLGYFVAEHDDHHLARVTRLWKLLAGNRA